MQVEIWRIQKQRLELAKAPWQPARDKPSQRLRAGM
jgi:hypothetical protein